MKNTYCCVLSIDDIVVNIADSNTTGVVSRIDNSDISGVVNTGSSDKLGSRIAE